MENPKARVRWVARGASLLALAFVLTVLSAWIPAWWMPTRTFAAMAMSDSKNPADPAGIWRDTVPASWGDRALSTTKIGIGLQTLRGYTAVGPRLRYVQGDHLGVSVSAAGVAFDTTGEGNLLDRYEIGWPIRSMTCTGPEDNRPPVGGAIAEFYARGIPVPAYRALGMKADRRLPVRPIWARFVLSLAVWTVMLLALRFAVRLPKRLRLRKRRRRGLCLACGYDIAGTDVCPECNTARG